MIGSLNMFLLDYLIIPIWAVFSAMGNWECAPVMIPVTIVFLLLNYFNTRNATRLFLLDINLAAASVAGIILNTFLYIKFVYADGIVITKMVSLIFFITLFIVFFCILCLLFKTLMHKRNMRIINRMAYYDEYEEDDEDDEDDEDEDYGDYDEERDFKLPELGRGLHDDDEEDEEDEEEEDDVDDDEPQESSGPKFRVVKKNR